MALQLRWMYPRHYPIIVLPSRIDFSNIDNQTIRSAIAQGGLHARYLLLHVVETAGAMVYGSDIEDQESDERHPGAWKITENNLKKKDMM